MDKKNITNDLLAEIQNKIFKKVRLNEQALLKIKNNSFSLLEKWQQFLQIIFPLQLSVIKNYGFEETQSGLSHFNEIYAQQSINSFDLKQLNKQKWLFILEKAFGVTEFKEISLQSAQKLIIDIAEQMTSKTFLQQIDSIVKSFSDELSLIEKRKAVLTILLPLHMSVMAKHGFEGKDGYVQAQRAIMDYYHDPLIS